MPACLFVSEDGTREEVDWDQREVAVRLGGPVSFVGRLDDLDVVVVARRDAPHLAVHRWSGSGLFFEDTEVRGPIVLAHADDADVDLAALRALPLAYMQAEQCRREED